MMRWKLSCYTSVIRNSSDEIVLYNSFMGAVAKILPGQIKDIEKFLQQGIAEKEYSDQHVKELCDAGFFIPSDKDEKNLVTSVLERERKAVFRMIILPHEKCNFRCVYCYEDYKNGKMNNDIVSGLKALSTLLSDDYKGISVSWFGGEPLLARDVIYELSDSFINSCKQKSINYTSSIVTNGYLLTQDTVHELLKHEVKYFQVTLDGPEIIHNKTRKLINGEGTYKTILDNLTQMKNRDDDFTVRIRINFNDELLPLIEEWLSKEISPLFANDDRFALRFHSIGKWGGKNDASLSTCDSRSASQFKHELTEKAYNHNFSNEVIKNYLKPHGNVCYAGKESSIVIGSDGALYKCTVAFNDARNQIGRINKDGKLIINSELCNKWINLNKKDLDSCISCLIYPSCQGRSCPLAKLNRDKPPCPLSSEEIKTLVNMISSPPS